MKKNVIIGSVICFCTIIIFLAFYNKLPANVPIHFDSSGNANSTWPKEAVVFGVPVVAILLNMIAAYSLQKKEEKRTFMYYIIPAIAVITTIVILILAL